jgi:hypothetical protein
MPTPDETAIITEIDRRTDHLKSEMERVAQHRKLLEAENPAAVPLQDAIWEKVLRDTGLQDAMAQIEKALERGGLSPEVISALKRQQQVCKVALALLSSRARDQ